MLDKERCIKEQIYSEVLVMLVALKLPVKFSKCFLRPSQCEFEVVQQNSVSCRCESLEIRLLYRKLSGI